MEGVVQQDILFPRKDKVKFQGQKLALGLGKKTLPKRNKLGEGKGVQGGSFQVPGVGLGFGALLSPAESIWQDMSISSPPARRVRRQPPPFSLHLKIRGVGFGTSR